MAILSSVNGFLLKIASWIVIILMGVIAIIIPYEVFGRYVLGDMPAWSGEVTTFSLVWISMLGAAVGLPRGYQIGMTFFVEKLPAGAQKIVNIISHLLTLFILLVLFFFGLDQSLYNLHQTSPAMEISMALPYLAIPVGALIMALTTVEQLAKVIWPSALKQKA